MKVVAPSMPPATPDPLLHLISTLLDARAATLFLGAGASREGTQQGKPYPSFEDLIRRLVRENFPKNESIDDLGAAFRDLVASWTREFPLSAKLSKYLAGRPGLAHYELAALSLALRPEIDFLLYLTTNFDNLLEQAFHALEGKTRIPFQTVTGTLSSDYTERATSNLLNNLETHTRSGNPVVLKLFGDLAWNSPIFDQEEMRFPESVANKLRQWLDRPTVFIGYSFSDAIIRQIILGAGSSSPIFVVDPRSSLPAWLDSTNRVHHLKLTCSQFATSAIDLLLKREPSYREPLISLLKSFSPALRYPDRKSLANALQTQSKSSLLRASAKLVGGPLHHPRLPDTPLKPIERPDSAPPLNAFLAGQRPLLAVLGDSGSGKTTWLYQAAKKLPLTLYYDAHHLEAAGSLTATIAQDLRIATQELERLFRYVPELLEPGERLVIMIDAINEAVRLSPVVLKAEIEALASNFPQSVKLIYTCRRVYWDSHVTGRSPIARELYYDTVLFYLGGFSERETRDAFNEYKEHFSLSGTYSTLNDQLRAKISDPLMLRMLAEGYANSSLPAFAPAVLIFQRYYRTLQKRFALSSSLTFLALLIRRKAALSVAWNPESDQFSVITMRTDPELAPFFPNGAVATTTGSDPLFLLEDEGVLVPVDPERRSYRFRYDRFYEYLLGIEVGSHLDTTSASSLCATLTSLIASVHQLHFSYSQAVKSEIVRRTLLEEESSRAFLTRHALSVLLGEGADARVSHFVKETLRELLCETTVDVVGVIREAFDNVATSLPLVLDVVSDSLDQLLPIAVEGILSGNPQLARRCVRALTPALVEADTRRTVERVVLSSFRETQYLDQSLAEALVYVSGAYPASSEARNFDWWPELRELWRRALRLSQARDAASRTVLQQAFCRVVDREGAKFFPSDSNKLGLHYLWQDMPEDILQAAKRLPAMLRRNELHDSDTELLRFFGSEIKDWADRDKPLTGKLFTYRLEYRLSQWVLIYHSSRDYERVARILEQFAATDYWLTIDFALCTMQFILLYAYADDHRVIEDGFARMKSWVLLLEDCPQFFATLDRPDPFITSYNPLAQTATVDARFFSQESMPVDFLSDWIGAVDPQRCSLGVLAARQLWQGFPHQVLHSLRPATGRSEPKVTDLVDRTLREMYYVFPRMVERAFSLWALAPARVQSIRFRMDVPEPAGVEFRAEKVYKELFLQGDQRRMQVAEWYDHLLSSSGLEAFCADLLHFLVSSGDLEW